jgi:hypothetical protein
MGKLPGACLGLTSWLGWMSASPGAFWLLKRKVSSYISQSKKNNFISARPAMVVKAGMGMPWWWPMPPWHGGCQVSMATCCGPRLRPLALAVLFLEWSISTFHGSYSSWFLTHGIPCPFLITTCQKVVRPGPTWEPLFQVVAYSGSFWVSFSYPRPLLSFYFFWKCCWFFRPKPFFLDTLNLKPYSYM